MSIKLEIIDSLSIFLFTLILYFLSVFSKRLGEVMGMKKYYYLYYAGIFFTFSGSIIMAMVDLKNTNLIGYTFFSIGLTLGLVASIKYWGWVIKELIKG